MAAQHSIIQQCPNCGKVLTFSHEETNMMQCSCGTVAYISKEGRMAEKALPIIFNAQDLIQPGTSGQWQKEGFRVLGRFRAWFEQSVFNYWTILFNDGQLALLGEGYGLYAIYKKTEIEKRFLSGNLSVLENGHTEELFADQSFMLERTYSCKKWEVEGELYFPAIQNRMSIYQFSHPSGRHVELMELHSGIVEAFELFYTSFSELKLTNTRTVEYQGKSFVCTQCHKEVIVKQYPYSQSCTCAHCKATYALQTEGYYKFIYTRDREDIASSIELGCSGKIRGIEYEVIGFALKEECNIYHSRWREYTLYNKSEGFAFLSEFDGHWIYVRERGDMPVVEPSRVDSFEYDGEPFQLFNSYTYNTLETLGEFPYNICDVRETVCREFISPPEMWIVERSSDEGMIWFSGESVPAVELAREFQFPGGLPVQKGVGAIQPKGFIATQKLLAVTGVAVLIFILVHLFTSTSRYDRVLLDQDYFYSADSTRSISMVTRAFTLDRWRSNLKFNISAPVDNSWFELDANLVNVATGTHYELDKGIEYYHGYEDGESWSEGDNHEVAYLGQIPSGNYFLQLQGVRDTTANRPHSYHVTVTYDTDNTSNLYICIGILLLWPIIQYIRIQNTEKKRWDNSPFSPYSNED